MSAFNKCPNPMCPSSKPTQMYACRPCWYSLPKTIRDSIWHGYKTSASMWSDADERARKYWNAKKLEAVRS